MLEEALSDLQPVGLGARRPLVCCLGTVMGVPPSPPGACGLLLPQLLVAFEKRTCFQSRLTEETSALSSRKAALRVPSGL